MEGFSLAGRPACTDPVGDSLGRPEDYPFRGAAQGPGSAMPRASKWAAALDTTESEDIRSKRLSACTTAARKELLAASFRAERRCRRTRLLPTQAPMTPLPHGFYRSFTMLGLSCESQRVTKMA